MKRSTETKLRMKEAQLQVAAKCREQWGIGKSPESEQKRVAKRKDVPWSENARNVKREKPTAIPVQAFKKDTGELVGEWESMALCAKELNCDLAAIWKILSGFMSKAPDGTMRPYKSHKGYTFRYK
jgi:hypothetical protein